MMTHWQDYKRATMATALYPEAGTGSPVEIAYLSLGLIGEVGEISDVFKDAHFKQEKVLGELGDCFWYIARLDDTLLKLSNDHQLVELKVDLEKLYHTDNVFSFANFSKKLIRDGVQAVPKVSEALQNITMFVTTYAAGALMTLGHPEPTIETISEHILYPNLEKLLSRKERGVINGSGDNR